MEDRTAELLERIRKRQQVREALNDVEAWILEEEEPIDPVVVSAPIKR